MPVFKYTARDDAGNTVQGQVSAATQTDAAKLVRAEGKFVISVEAAGAAAKPMKKSALGGLGGGSLLGEKYKHDDLIFFTNQLAVMVETGVSLADALEACEHDGNSPVFARTLRAVIEEVKGGSEFSTALANYPRVFAPIYINLIKASEASGLMGPMLRRLAEYLEHQREMTKKIKGAVTYPIVMFVFAIGVTIFLMTFVLPKFSAIYAGREDKLPALTKFLMTLSDGMVSYGLFIIVGLVAGGVGLFFYFRTPKGQITGERIKLGIPLVGALYHKTYLSRSLRTLGTMIHSGVSMLEGVRLTSAACGSRSYAAMWNEVNEKLESGLQLSDALADNKQVSKAINRMLAAGERSGQLGPVMERVATFCEGELNVAIKTLTGMMEPAIVMFLGIVVGGLVLALLLPIFTISKAMH